MSEGIYIHGTEPSERDQIGSLEPGKRANFTLYDCADYREIAYYFGVSQTHSVYVSGKRLL